jgi:hypothetical protein
MNEQIAHALIDAELVRLRTLPYSELIELVTAIETKDVLAEDGKTYQLEIEAVWDSKQGGDVRVIVVADDGGWRSLNPTTRSFIMRPDGKFVGESSCAQ